MAGTGLGNALRWLKDALSTKELVVGMSHYVVKDSWIKATDGRLVAAHPCEDLGNFLVPGNEFEKLVNRMGEDITITTPEAGLIELKVKRTRARIKTLDTDVWQHPEIANSEWTPVPKGLIEAFAKLRPFISENANHAWAMGVIIHDEWCYATNNVAVAGVQTPQVGNISVIVPLWAIDFVIARPEGIAEWHWAPDHLAFRWSNGAWLRSVLIDAPIPMQVVDLVQRAMYETPEVLITPEFREAYNGIASIAEGSVEISATSIRSTYKLAQVMEEFETPELGDKNTIWGAKYLAPVIACAEWWSPHMGPQPVPFIGDGIMGYVVGRVS